jgi:hypothetical protein
MDTSEKKDNKSDYFLYIKEVDVRLFGLNAAAILSVIKAGEKWRTETNYRNKKANDIAEMHGDARWLPEDVVLGFTNQNFIERTFGICGRNGVIDALKILQACGVVKQHNNPNKKYSSDKSRYFRFLQDVYDRLVLELKESTEQTSMENTSLDIEAIENSDCLNLNDAPFKNKQEDDPTLINLNGTRLKINAPRLNSDSHIKNSNNIYINNNTQSINAREKITSELENEKNTNELVQVIITALSEKGMPAKRFYRNANAEIERLCEAGATVETFIKAYDLSDQATQGNFGISYLVKVVADLLSKAKTKTNKAHSNYGKDPPPQKDNFSETVYESDIRNALKWMKD